MSSDLISRSETERLLRAYADEVGCNRGGYELANGILKAACFLSDSENVPTAYDVDKVAERLEELRQNEIKLLCEHKSDTKDMQAMRGHNILQDAIKIVKSGGIE